MKKGLLLINLGTPTQPNTHSVRRYLREFLSDPRVITLPTLLRTALVNMIIVPFRSTRTAKAYQSIWTDQGSPLLLNSEKFVDELNQRLGSEYQIALGMRYGHPSIQTAITTLSGCDELTILPLYPHYSSSATGSCLEEVLTLLAKQTIIPSFKLIRDFHQHPAFISAQAELIQPYLSTHDHLLFSYHGIPENHLLKAGCAHAEQTRAVCLNDCLPTHSACYRAQCVATTQAIAKMLQLDEKYYSYSFQSRLGKIPWIKPYTDKKLIQLRQAGVEHLAVTCPSFVADCLETLEEIGIRAQEQWQTLGGRRLSLIPCLNTHTAWVQAVQSIIFLC